MRSPRPGSGARSRSSNSLASDDEDTPAAPEDQERSAQRGTYGFLALTQLLASAATDRRLKNWQRRALTVLARFSGSDGTCCVRMPHLAELLGCKRQPVQQALQAAERCGYLTSERRRGKNGAEGAKVFAFNLTLGGALACPIVWRDGGEHALERAGGSTLIDVRGEHALERAHNIPTEETSKISCCSPRAPTLQQLSEGKTVARQAHAPRARQRAFLLPIAGAGGGGSQQLLKRIDWHNLERRREFSGRLFGPGGSWWQLDPDGELAALLHDGESKVHDKAVAYEAQRHGRGLAYFAGAVARASGGRFSKAEILAGRAARKAGAA